MTMVASWGNVAKGQHEVLRLQSRFDVFPGPSTGAKVLPFGNGRSYGDSCLNVNGVLVHMRSLDRYIGFDREHGVLTCEAGVLLADILRLIVPAGWFLPVVPGTQLVTVGGAIANDVHGKNHHRVGTFGRHVLRFELLRSTGERLVCSTRNDRPLFAATVGGLGLTGIITWAELQLLPIAGPWMEVESIRFATLDEFFALSESSANAYDYTVAWIDCLARGRNLGRGLFQRANHSSISAAPPRRRRVITVPFTTPASIVNPTSLRVFNSIYYHRQRGARRLRQEHFETFFFPLDALRNWNRLYGPRGFHQYQCVVPTSTARDSIAALLDAIAADGLGSFLAVLKQCGKIESPGMLSFPRAGTTLAVDFPNRPTRLNRLFQRMDQIVSHANGRLYPAKDARMSRSLFQTGYTRSEEFAAFIDPRCTSSFWSRVGVMP